MQRQTSLSSLRKSRPLLLQKIRAIWAVPSYSTPMSADESEDELNYREIIEKEVQMVLSVPSGLPSAPSTRNFRDRQTDSFVLGHEPTHTPALFQAGSASRNPRY